MPSDQQLNADINTELDIEIRKKMFLVPITTKGAKSILSCEYVTCAIFVIMRIWRIAP